MATYNINKSMLKYEISNEQIDFALNELKFNQDNSEAIELLCAYAIQLKARSGAKQITSEEIYEKVNLLIVDSILYDLVAEDILEESFDIKKQEYVYNLTEKGKELAKNDQIQEG